MNIETGELRESGELQQSEIKSGKWVPVERDLTAKETFEKQIRLYSPCGCGSGKKFKFCCHRKPSK